MSLTLRKLTLFFIFAFGSFASYGVTANFTQDYVSGCSPLVVHFTNSSSGATSYYWDLGNGTNSTLTNVSGSYITPGTYTVVLTAYNGSSSSTHTITITVFPSPTVSFYASDTAICPGTSTTFTSTSTPGVSGAMTYYWNFGDGTNSTAASPTHVYSTPGYYNVTLIVTNSAGCSSSLTTGAYIHVYNHINISFASTSYYCHTPANVTFTNSTTGAGPFTYAWDFGDGNTSTSATPTNTYASTGSYTVRLIVTDANGCRDTLTRTSYITVGTISAAFTPVTGACVNSWVTFYNASSSHITSAWDFGDGGTSTTDTGYHHYTTPGTYTVRLIIFNGYCRDTAYSSITIYPSPTGSFTWSPLLPCPAPAGITFIGSVPAGSSVTWLFGDGGTGSGATAAHTYMTNSTDSVKMCITDINGCTDTVTNILRLMDIDLLVTPSPGHGCTPLTVNYSTTLQGIYSDHTIATYPYGVTSYIWNFGDGSATSTAATPTHTFTAVGVYHTILTITTANGCTVSDTVDIYVGAPPTATFTVSRTHICYSETIWFYAHADSADHYYWDFGDGGSSFDTFSSTSHVFTRPGVFHVTLTPYFNGCPGAPFTYSDSFIIDSPMAIPNLSYSCVPYTKVFFFDSSFGDDTHIWFFGDGYSSTSDTVTHIYSSMTTYTATLTTYNIESGCRDTAIIPVTVIPPILNVTASDTTLCKGDIIVFTATITGGSVSAFGWNLTSIGSSFGTTDSSYSYTDTFTASGIYTVKFTVRDSHDCIDSIVKTNWIRVGQPIDSFGAVPVSGCSPLTVTFNDSTTDIAGCYMTNWRWSFGDGSTATATTTPVAHTYTAAGIYSVYSIVTDNMGCIDTSVRLSYITVWKPHAVFNTANTFPCLGTNVHFNNTSSGITGAFWMFGDGDTSSALSADHVYTAIGTYTVKLVVFDSHGCTDTATYVNYLNVTKPTAAFYMSDSFSICPPLNVSFYNTSTAATSYAWDFGDGGTSVFVSPSDLYTTPGYYQVRLIATNSHGCKDTAYRHVNLYGYAGAFSYTPDTGCAPLLVHFSASISNVPNIIWDYADGTTTAASYSDTSSHLYLNPGAYLPKLILSDNSGCQNSSTAIDTIKVDAVRPGFTTNPFPVCVNTDIFYVDTSHSYFSTVTQWHWVFGPGDTSNVASPFYHYNAVGVYTVTLTATDGWGCTSSATQTVTVYPPPTVSASPDTVICVGDSATLEGHGALSYTWTPPATLSCPTCQTTFANPVTVTTYTVTGKDVHGCINTDTVMVSMRTHTLSHAWGDTEVCRYVPVHLFDTGGNKYTWIPSIGLTDASIWNPIATPPSTITYTVIAQLGSCIPDTNYVSLIIHQLPVVNAGPDQTLLAGQLAYLNATGSLISSLLWSPAGTLDCDSCANVIAHMATTTTYVVTATSDFGCKSSDAVTISVFCDESQIFIPNTFTPNGDGENDIFYPRGSGVSIIKAFRVYNRWGELIFERTNIAINDKANAWDGSYQGSSARPDVYVYLIDATCGTGQPLFIKGDVTIIK